MVTNSELARVSATMKWSRGHTYPALCSRGRTGASVIPMERTSTPPGSETTWTGSTGPPGRSRGSREDAEDLVQETYARVLGRPRLLRNEDDLGYLLRALRNTFLNQKRAESRRLRPDALPEQLDLVADPHARRPGGCARRSRALRGDRRASG